MEVVEEEVELIRNKLPTPSNGQANTGNGGGLANTVSPYKSNGAGGSGMVLIAYPSPA